MYADVENLETICESHWGSNPLRNLRCLGQVSIAQEKVVALKRNERNVICKPDERPLALHAHRLFVSGNNEATNGVGHTITPNGKTSATPAQQS